MRSPGDQEEADITRRAQKRFLEAFARVGVVAYACRTAKVGRATVYEWRERYPAFVEAMDAALAVAIELMEEEVHRRAVRGTLSPVYYKGDVVGQVREYSDTLLMFLVKRHKAEYRDQSSVDVRAQLKASMEITLEDGRADAQANLSPDDYDRIARAVLDT